MLFFVRNVHFNSYLFDLRLYENIVLYFTLSSLNTKSKKSMESVIKFKLTFCPQM